MVSRRIGGLVLLDDVGAPHQQPALARIAAHARPKRRARNLGVAVERNGAERLAILAVRGLLNTERQFLVEVVRLRVRHFPKEVAEKRRAPAGAGSGGIAVLTRDGLCSLFVLFKAVDANVAGASLPSLTA